jgi:hypothetical protein
MLNLTFFPPHKYGKKRLSSYGVFCMKEVAFTLALTFSVCTNPAKATNLNMESGRPVTNYTLTNTSVAVSVLNGGCLANYTFSQKLPNPVGVSNILVGATVTIVFLNGTDASSFSGGTFNGTAINVLTASNPNQFTLSFTAPAAVSGSGTTFTMVINGIGNAPSGNAGNASVTIDNSSGGTDSDNTYSYTLSVLIEPFFPYPGYVPSYAQANTLGYCVNNLVSGETYCFDYILPGSGTVTTAFVTNSSCGSGGGSQSGTYNASNSVGLVGLTTYQEECILLNTGNFIWGTGAGQTSGTIYTCCYTAPGGCANISFCPMLDCSAGNCTPATLPVGLIYLSAIPKDKTVILQWATASETNNSFFTVERTEDGVTYQPIASVKGAGNSSRLLLYQLADDAPLPGQSYYRLKQTDINGHFTYSYTVSVSFTVTDYLNSRYDPKMKVLTLSLHSNSDNMQMNTEVLDALGKTIIQRSENCGKGFNEVKIDACSLCTGIYFVRMEIGQHIYFKKFIVSR